MSIDSRTDGSGGRVGPVIFANERARAQLEEHGHVLTFRTSDRTTGETHVRYGRTEPKQYDCEIELVEHTEERRTIYHRMAEFYHQAGFDGPSEWERAIEEFHGEVPEEGWFYRVTIAEEDRTGPVDQPEVRTDGGAPDSSGGSLDRVMVDIETLGLERGAAILSIGAVRFGPGLLGDQYEGHISLSSCQEAGLEIDAGTLEWWLDQDEAAQAQLTKGIDIRQVLRSFSEWYGDADEVWANSPSFDCELLEAAFNAVDMEAPWDFHEERDFRTVKSLPVAPEVEQDGVEHDALDDAMHQAYIAAAALRRLEGHRWDDDEVTAPAGGPP
ncbi:3'-5' exonuclease [Haloglomus irregulare]|jgi:hypothetical protein|nr:3'-5' exonuclease [Haloglomus irregulare]